MPVLASLTQKDQLLKVAFLTDGIWPFVVGGMQKHSYHLCRIWAKNGVYVHVYHPQIEATIIDLSAVFSDEEQKFVSLTVVPFPSKHRFPGHYLRSSYLYSKALFHELERNNDFDVVYAKGLTGWYLLKNRQKFMRSFPICINVHGYEYFQKAADLRSYLQQLLLRPSFKLVNRQADFIFSYSPRITHLIKSKISRLKGQVVEVPAALDSSFIDSAGANSTAPPVRFVFIGRFERRKGIQELIKAQRKISGSHELHVVGEIPKSFFSDSSNVQVYGEVRDVRRIASILSEADVLVCPSYAEGMPNVILEGMARGCAIIATNVGAIPDMVDAENGWIISPGSVDELASAMEKAIALRSEELTNMKRASINKVAEHYTWAHVENAYINFFATIKTLSTGNSLRTSASH